MKRWNLTEPLIYRLSRNNSQMVTLGKMIQCLNCDVSLDDSTIMRSVESMVGLAVLRIEANFGSIDFELYDGYGRCAYKIDIKDVILRGKYLL